MIDDNPPAPRALISRSWDFWLLGGASLVVWMWMACSSNFRGLYGVGDHFTDLVAAMATVNLIANYPHFLASYHLAYFRGKAFIRRHWFQTLAVPLAMAAVIGWTYTLVCDSSGPAQRELGANVMDGLVNLMFLSAGWHYIKQVFGVTMVYAVFDRYPLLRWQRELIRYSLLALWWHSFAWYGRFGGQGDLFGLPYRSWHKLLPGWCVPLTGCILLLTFSAVVALVVVRNWRQNHRPSLNLVTPYLAMFVWFAPWLRQTEYFLYTVPFFHSMQYLVFVYRVERHRSRHLAEMQATALAMALVAAGWLSFEFLPGMFDAWLFQRSSFSFFLLSASVFINVHHFFLDNVLWRLGDDVEVRQALLEG